MRALLRLYLPALIPSWRFFEEIGPSARIELRIDGGPWREYRSLPKRISPLQALRRMVWNPEWTEHLFLVSCAERLMTHPTDHSVTELETRLTKISQAPKGARLQFRLKFLSREGGKVVSHVAYESAGWTVDEL